MWRPSFGDVPADDVPITHVTNGVHLPTFLSPPMRGLPDRHLGARAGSRARPTPRPGRPSRRSRTRSLGRLQAGPPAARRLRQGEVGGGPAAARRGSESVRAVAETFSEDTLTLGFARRIATYKRLFPPTYDPERVRRIFADGPALQMVVAGQGTPARRQRQADARRRVRALQGGRDHVTCGVPEDHDLCRGGRSCAATPGSTS